jgi:hypothetical protein
VDVAIQVERSRALALLAGLGGDARSGVTPAEAAALADQSVAALAAAVKTGWALPSELKEPDFDPVRSRDDFQKLLAEVEAKAAKKAGESKNQRKTKEVGSGIEDKAGRTGVVQLTGGVLYPFVAGHLSPRSRS